MAEVLHGNASADLLNARADKTQVYGLQGNDTLTADGKSNVLLVGGSGNDSLIMSGGNGTLSGGDGSDTFELTYSADKKLSAIIEDLEPVNDKIIVNFDGNTAPQLSSSVSGNNVVWKDGDGNFNVTLKGVRDNDYFDGDVSDEAWEILRLTNNQREKKNLSLLTLSDGLMSGASVRAEEITALGMSGILTDHTRPDGTDFSTVLDGKYNYPSENLDAGAESPVQVMRDWIGSTAHFANIMNSKFQKLGVGYNYNEEDPAYQKWYWVQLFADSLKSPETVSTADLLTANMQVSASPKLITLSNNPDNYTNTAFGATIQALGGNDTINNAVLNVTIDGGANNDQIALASSAENNLIQYTAGDGNDTVRGFNEDDMLSITGGEYTRSTVGNDIVFTVNEGSVRLVDAKSLATLNIDGTRNKFIPLTEGDDIYENSIEGATIAALGGNDTIENGSDYYYILRDDNRYEYHPSMVADNVSINGGAGNDSIFNYHGVNVKIDGGEGHDTIHNRNDLVTIYAGNGDDSVSNDGSNVSINAGDGNNEISNSDGDSVTISAGTGDDSISNSGSNVSINAGDGNNEIRNSNGDLVTIYAGDGSDNIFNDSSNVSINAGDGNNEIRNSNGGSVTISAGTGDDSVSNDGSNVSINAGDGNNEISNSDGDSVTISAGTGDDSVSNDGSNVSINAGDGSNFIRNWEEDSKNITINSGAGDDTIDNNGSKVIVNVGDGNDSIRNGVAHLISYDGVTATSYDSVDGGDSASISGGASNDTIYSMGSKVTINGGLDNDLISLSSYSKNNVIEYSAGDGRDQVWYFDGDDTLQIGGGTGTYSTQISGNDIIVNVGVGSVTLVDVASLAAVKIVGVKSKPENYLPITLTENADTYSNNVEGATILALGGNDSITNEGVNVSINGGADNDYLINSTMNVIIDGDAGKDEIFNSGNNVTINGGADNDSIDNSGSQVSIDGGADNDTLLSSGSNVSIDGGLGNDSISLSRDAQNNMIQYAAGDGNDVVRGFKATDTLHLLTAGYVRSTVGNDILFKIGEGSVKLSGSAGLSSIDLEITAINPGGEDKLFTLTDEDDSYYNIVDDATIAALGGNDSIQNGHYNHHPDERIFAHNVSIDGGNGDDYVHNWQGRSVTIDGGAGNDTLSNIACNSVTLVGGAGNDSLKHAIGSSISIDGGEGDDYLENGNDSEYITIDGGAGDDTIYAYFCSFITINAGDGNDSISNGLTSSNAKIDAGDGDDTIGNNWGDKVTINADTGNDSIYNNGEKASIEAGDGNDTIDNTGDSTTINADNGNDSISNSGSNVSINAGVGNDSISNSGDSVTITTGDSNDYIRNSWGDSVSVDSGNGDDFIENDLGKNVTIAGGTGTDQISLSSYAENTFIQYTEGDGNDSVWGLGESSTLNISANVYSSVESGDDIIITVGEGSITLKDAREKPPHIILGSSGSSGGTSGSSGGGGGSASGGGSSSGSGSGSSGSSGSGSGGSSGSSSGGSGSSGSSGSGSSGSGRTAVGSRGRSSSTSSNTSGGNNVSGTTSSSRSGGGRIAMPNSTVDLMSNWATSTAQPTATAQRVYTGGNQVIGDYQSGEKIVFSEVYTGSFYDGAGNYCVGSSTGALVIQNAMDKVIDLSDVAGNDFVKAYAATTAGVIDGRGLAGFEIINGSAGADAIFAGDGGSQLWGGADYVQDIMVGGGGTDIFISGRTQGADIVLNASSTDIVHLNDATLSDIIATEENNGVIAVAFNTGNVIAVQSSEALSATFMLTDGSIYRFNHVTKNWQTT